MFVVFEEDGGFKLGRVIQDQNTTLQVETLHGKRVKVKRTHVLLEFKEPDLATVHQQAEEEQSQLEVSFLWETSSPEAELNFLQIAKDYYGKPPSPAEALAVLQTLHNAPIYFHRKGKGNYRCAPESIVRAALAGVARRAEEAERVERWSQQLQAHQWPQEWDENTRNKLLYKPDRQELATKAVEAACAKLGCSTLNLLREAHVIQSAHDYHFGRFLYQYFPKGTGWENLPALDLSSLDALPLGNVQALSLDDSTTTEIDDAFSLTSLGEERYEVGIHIAVPALLIQAESEWDNIARMRYSTVYMPGHKITMLPENLIEAFSLNEGNITPVLSLYVTCTSEGEILEHRTVLEKIRIAANLRLEHLPDALFDQEDDTWGTYSPYASQLKTIHQLAHAIYVRRGKPDLPRTDYSFRVEDVGTDQERIHIDQRARGSRPDRMVSEWMIVANTLWSGLLTDAKAAAFYRVQMGGKVKTSSHSDAHQGLNVPHYMWSTSPLRRYADLLNQQQLIALVRGEPFPYSPSDSHFLQGMSEFETAYSAYSQFQDQMELHWCLRWLEQENIKGLEATTLMRESLVRLNRLPMVVKVNGLPTPSVPGTLCRLQLNGLDTWSLESHWQFESLVSPPSSPLDLEQKETICP
ncbi:MAG: ribonuclease catalytic domain-containing protein [Pseudomonadota bacterium]